MDEIDLAVVGQDPRFGGGFKTQAETFWRAVRDLGRDPHLFYLSRARATSLLRPSIAIGPVREQQGIFAGTAYPSILPELDAFNQIVGGRLMADALRRPRSLWVCAASAPYGYAALRSGRPYGCWIGTSLVAEWAGRAPLLPASRRLALRINRRPLLRLERDVLQGAHAVYATTPYSRHAIAEAADIPVEQVGALPIPVDFLDASPEPDDEWLPRLERPVIAFVGRGSDPRKNVRLLLDAVDAVRETHSEVRVRLIGDAPDGYLRRRLGDHVEVLGHVDSIGEHLRTASLFVLPSHQEGFGIVAAEALANGVPAVVTPCGGPEDLLRNSGGGIVLSGFSPEEMAATLLELLQDPERLRRMRRIGREYVLREHSPERLGELAVEALARVDAA